MMYNIGAKIYKHFNKNNCNYLYALVTKYEKVYPCVFKLCEKELYGELYGFPCILYSVADFSKQDENIFFENYVDYMFRFVDCPSVVFENVKFSNTNISLITKWFESSGNTNIIFKNCTLPDSSVVEYAIWGGSDWVRFSLKTEASE